MAKIRSYMVEHRRFIEAKTPMPNRSKIEPGHIIQFSYYGKDVHTRTPTVLVLNPEWKGLLHGVTINYIPKATLEKLVKQVKLKVAERIARLTKLRLNILKGSITNPEKFYYTELKPFIKINFPEGQTPYRTFTPKEMKGIKIVDYRFEKYKKGDEGAL